MSDIQILISPFHPLLSVFVFFLTLVFSASLVQGRRTPGATLAWLLAIALIPYVGIPLYLLLGGRKVGTGRAAKAKIYALTGHPAAPRDLPAIQKILRNAGVPAETSNNRVSLISDGVQAYRQVIELLGRAKVAIHIEIFILGGDEIGSAIVELLCQKAREGVEVRLLMDGLGSFWGNRKALRELRAAGGQISSFMPLLHMPFRWRSDLRDHRKIIVVDGKLAFVGGRNLAHEYMGPTPDQKRWEDLSLLVSGSAVQPIQSIFSEDWQYATQGRFKELANISDRSVAGSITGELASQRIQVVASGPDVPQDTLYEAIISGIYDAKDRVWIASPYFIPDESLTRALELACRRGVDVRVLIPARSNHFLADLGRGSYLRQIQAAGAQIFRFPKMLHAKAILIDRDCAIVGSANMDVRSFFLNYEICVFNYSKPLIADLEAWFVASSSQAIAGYDPLRFGVRTLEGIGRILGPML